VAAGCDQSVFKAFENAGVRKCKYQADPEGSSSGELDEIHDDVQPSPNDFEEWLNHTMKGIELITLSSNNEEEVSNLFHISYLNAKYH